MSPANPLRWQPHPDAWLLGILLLGGYFYAMAAWGPTLAPGRAPASRRHKQAFVAGVATLWLASDYPIHGLSEELFSVHMLQHTIYSLISAPLLILGVPGWLWRKLLSPRPVQAVWRVATKPLVALAIFNGWIVVYHSPMMVNTSVHSEVLHFLMHIGWVASALVMWWPVLSPLPEFPHLSQAGRMLFLFAQSIVPTVPASFLTFSHAPVYGAYDTATRAFGLGVIDDQQIAGLLMKIGGGFLIWGVIAVLFFRWATQERTGGPDPLYWRDLEAGLEPATQGAR